VDLNIGHHVANTSTIAKRKREEDAEKQEKIKNGISRFFSAKAATAAPKVKVRPESGYMVDW
jgi:hypothetical protein